ncbi:single-stranded-DNA-specific exonuclease RecJ [Hyphomicrobiales bacterium FT118]|uniref:Single-stranded-DNA-specific exonuclease RecJ n=2 Tax=Futiania mangrovi TaxID=2959716 RepID=A0A9J6PE73_9PROT|nr:single-stranded-DNA-specific exonuclease RecJ [Futiania mangrovii]MCP1336051.1 single-stranded-DNA-specific exonuclease RecJ [Futiania mangrovii]
MTDTISGAAPGADISALGVARSLTGRRWVHRADCDRTALAIAQTAGVPEVIGRVLAGRGVSPASAERYLAPSLREDLPDPSLIADMDAGAVRLADAVEAGEKVGIFGDYDVDGATSSALLVRLLRLLGTPVAVHIPDRLAEGYGPNLPALLALKEKGASLVVTVDCGAAAHEVLGAARDAGLDIVVSDHHQTGDAPLPVLAHINPNRPDCGSGLGQLAAVGVTFLLAVALVRELRGRGWFDRSGRPVPDLVQLLDLVALGTVADVVPLTGPNRALVVRGLQIMARRGNAGLAALADVAKLRQRPDCYHLGFLLGPRVNAGGRVGRPDAGSRLLALDDPQEAAAIACDLDAWNRERKEIEAAVLDAALARAEISGADAVPVVTVAGEGWHPGVIGIVASRLKERYGRPAIVIGMENGMGKGSGRSIAGVDLGRAVRAAADEGLLVAGGGHAMAAGLTVAEHALDAFSAFLADRLAADVEAARADAALHIDGAVALGGATADLVDLLEKAGPYGAGNPQPRLAFTGVRIAHLSVMGEAHLRLSLADSSGTRVKGVAFRAVGEALGKALEEARGTHLHIAGKLRRDDWKGADAVEIQIDDVALAEA